jgi:hypothetical protein
MQPLRAEAARPMNSRGGVCRLAFEAHGSELTRRSSLRGTTWRNVLQSDNSALPLCMLPGRLFGGGPALALHRRCVRPRELPAGIIKRTYRAMISSYDIRSIQGVMP